MPQAVAFVLSGAVAGAGIGAAIAFQAVSLVVLGAISRKLTDRKSPTGTQTLEREVTVRATDAYETFVYGRAMAGGLTVYHNATTTSISNANNIMAHVVKWAGHRVNCIEYFRLDDRKLDPAVDSIGWNPVTYTGSGLVHTGVFRGYNDNKQQLTSGVPPTRMRWYLGNQTSADAVLTQWFPDWGTSFIGKERAYGVLEVAQVDADSATDRVFQGGFPTNIQAYVHGKSVFDPRKYALNHDPLFRALGTSWWFADGNSSALSTKSEWSLDHGLGGTTDFGATIITNSTNNSNQFLFHEPVPCDPSSRYTIFMRARRVVGDRPVWWGVSFWTAEGANIEGFSGLGWPALGTFWYAIPNTQLPTDWTELTYAIGSGGLAIPTSARFMRVGFWGVSSSAAFTPNTTQIWVQDMGVRLGWGSRQLPDVASTWEYSENPALCAADYLRNEVFGFGKESRQPVNASRYALNGDPCWRRHNTLNVGSYWRSAAGSGNGAAIAGVASLHTAQTGAPVGRRALIIVASLSSSIFPVDFFSDPVPIDPSGFYTISVHAKQSGPRAVWLACAFLDASGVNIIGNSGSDASGDWTLGTYHYWLANRPLPSAWSNFLTTIGSGTGRSIPTSARYVQIGALCVTSFGDNSETEQYFQEYMIQPGTTIKRFIEPWEQIQWASVASAASWCDGQVSTPSGTQVRFACNGQGHTGRSYRENLRDIIGAGNLRCTYGQSGWLMFGGWQEPTITLNKADITGPIEVRGSADTRDRYNTVRGTFFDRHQDGKRVPFANVSAAEYRARDGSMELYEDVDLPFTDDWWMAQRVAFGLLEQGDNQMLAKVPVGLKAFGLQVGRHVAIKNDVMSWSPKNFLMTDITYDLKRGPQIVVREDFSTSYVDPSSAEYIPRSFAGASSHTPIVPQVSSVVITSRVEAINLRWVNPANRAFEWIDIYRRAGTNAFSGSTLIKSTRNDEHTDPVRAQDGTTYHYWFRTRDFAGNVSSVYPGLTTSFSAAAVIPVQRDPEYVFFEDFRYQNKAQFEEKWELALGSNGNIAFPSSGVVGGQVIAVNCHEAGYVSRIRIPYDPQALYQMGATYTQVRSTGSTTDRFFFGFYGYGADGTTKVNARGNDSNDFQYNFVANGLNASAVGTFQERVGHIRGHMATPESGTLYKNISDDLKLAARAHDNVRYVSPFFITNFDNGTGAAAIDALWVRKIRPGRASVVDPYITLPSNWLHNATTASSMSLLNGVSGPVVQFEHLAVSSEYSVLRLEPPGGWNANSPGLGQFLISERYQPEFHRTLHGSFTATIFARIYASSHGPNAISFEPRLLLYTRHGSLAGYFPFSRIHTNTGTGVVTDSIFMASDEWCDIAVTRHCVVPVNRFVNSLPPPYFGAVALGISASNAKSMYLAFIDYTIGG